MQLDFDNYKIDFSDKSILIGLSGGINSMAVLCWLVELPNEYKPKELHLYYAHFTEHSPDTFKFVADGIRYARKNFTNIKTIITRNSVIEYFRKSEMIPHPMLSPCSRELKIEPMLKYIEQEGIDLDLIGYVREEKRRIVNQIDRGVKNKTYPISHYTNEECFEIVEKHIGWFPKIYHIKEKGKRVFTHNNCLPCKNMTTKQIEKVEICFPTYWKKANELTCEIGQYWGRQADTSINHCKICED